MMCTADSDEDEVKDGPSQPPGHYLGAPAFKNQKSSDEHNRFSGDSYITNSSGSHNIIARDDDQTTRHYLIIFSKKRHLVPTKLLFEIKMPKMVVTISFQILRNLSYCFKVNFLRHIPKMCIIFETFRQATLFFL